MLRIVLRICIKTNGSFISDFEFVKSTNIIEDQIKYIIVPHICDSISIFHNMHENGIELAIFTNTIQNELLKCQKYK